MPKKPSIKESAYAFRHALTSDLGEASRLLKADPELIDCPVFGESESALHFFSVENQLEIVRWLLSHRSNPDGISEESTPLHGAAQLGHLAVCRCLLEAGADPNVRNFLDETALHKASAGGYTEIITLLLESGADPLIPEMCGELPIDQALPRKRDEVRAIFDQYASAEHRRSQGKPETK